jgi:hypothetical protein
MMARPKKKQLMSGVKTLSARTTPDVDLNSGRADLAYLLAHYTQGIRPDMNADLVFDFLYKQFTDMEQAGVPGITGEELYQLATQVSLLPLAGEHATQ